MFSIDTKIFTPSFIDFISKSEMLELIENEISLCRKYGEAGSAALLQAEKEKINLSRF